MLTIPFVLSSLYLLAATSPTPIQERSIRVALSKRASNSSGGALDIRVLEAQVATLLA